MNKSLPISIKCRLGELLKPGFEGINIGKYAFFPLPSKQVDGFKTELLLNFRDEWEEGQVHSDPKKEGEIVLAWLSMILRQKLKADSFTINNVQIPISNRNVIAFESPVNFLDNLLDLYQRFKSLPLKILEKYVRACECYQEALMISNSNPTMSFFLFVVCIECLCNKHYNFYQYLMKELSNKEEISKKEIGDIYDKFNEEYGLKNNFIQFILSNFEEWRKEFTEDDFKKLLSSVYEIRSLFTHEGQDFTKHINLIDNLKSKTVFTSIKDKKLEFPGLNYLSSIVRTVLINFLKKQENLEVDNIPKLASEDSKVDLALTEEAQKETIKKSSIITKNQIKYRD